MGRALERHRARDSQRGREAGEAMSKPQFIVIPEIAGRLIVGTTPNGYETALRSEIGVTHLIDVTPDAEIAQDDNWWYEAQGPDDDNARRVATLRWYMKESSLAGTVF